MTEDKQEFSPQFGNHLQMHQRKWQVLMWASPWPLPKYCCVVPLETRSSSFERPTEASWPGSYYLQICYIYKLPMADTPGPCPSPEIRPYANRPAVPNFQAQSHCQLPWRHHWRPGHSPAEYRNQPWEPHRHVHVLPRRMQLLGRATCRKAVRGAPTRRPGASHKPQGHAGGSGWSETGNTRHTMTM